jgi:hypothetical protein
MSLAPCVSISAMKTRAKSFALPFSRLAELFCAMNAALYPGMRPMKP